MGNINSAEHVCERLGDWPCAAPGCPRSVHGVELVVPAESGYKETIYKRVRYEQHWSDGTVQTLYRWEYLMERYR